MNTVTKFPPIRLQATAMGLSTWLGRAAPGDTFEYHRGFLAVDTMPHAERLPDRDRAELIRVAGLAYRAADRGLVHLVQRRHGENDFSYIAIARRRPRLATASLADVLAQAA